MIGRKCVCFGIMLFCFAVPSLGIAYTVGDSSGWTLGVDYANWSTSKTFVIGDSLVFKYGSGHTVDEVSESDYNTCTVGNPINRDNKGNTIILLQTPGKRFFICGVIGHCGSGMKLSIDVLASGGSPGGSAGSATPSPPPATAYRGILPATATTTTMIPDSASASPARMFPLHGVLVIIFGMAYIF